VKGPVKIKLLGGFMLGVKIKNTKSTPALPGKPRPSK
jgi:hypothetical protein